MARRASFVTNYSKASGRAVLQNDFAVRSGRRPSNIMCKSGDLHQPTSYNTPQSPYKPADTPAHPLCLNQGSRR